MFFALSMNIHKVSVQGRRERRGGAGGAPAPPPFPTMSWSKKKFFHVKLENKIFVKLLHVNNMWDFSLFIEQDVGDKK